MRYIPVKHFLILTLILCSSRVFAQSPQGAQFRLAGSHSFAEKHAKSWIVDREEIDELTGEKTVFKRVASALGDKSDFLLSKSRDKVTTYNIVAKGDAFLRNYRITVFDENVVSSFFYQSEGNPGVRTYILVPASLSRKTKVLLVMHGLGRNADDYIASWDKWGGQNDYIVVAPEFDNENWQRSRSYNLGNIFTGNSGAGSVNDRSKWSFQIVEDIYRTVNNGFGLNRDEFDIFGHSAGAQFVHRFAVFMPDSKFRLAIAANAGWYTIPDLRQSFPYGLKHENLAFSPVDLLAWSERRLLILRGTADTERTPNLRQTPEADLQGKNRYKRAGFMFKKIKAVNPETKWQLIDVPGVGHDQKGMAVAAQRQLELLYSKAR